MEEIFQKQKDFQNALKADTTTQEYKNAMLYAIIAEVVEAGNETAWKAWKKTQAIDNDKFIEELADIQLFLLNLVISSNKDYMIFLKMIEEKQKINFNRLQNGY